MIEIKTFIDNDDGDDEFIFLGTCITLSENGFYLKLSLDEFDVYTFLVTGLLKKCGDGSKQFYNITISRENDLLECIHRGDQREGDPVPNFWVKGSYGKQIDQEIRAEFIKVGAPLP